MGSLSLGHWLVVLYVILIVFGAGKLPRVMGDFARGIEDFKANLQDGDEPEQTLVRPTTEQRAQVEARVHGAGRRLATARRRADSWP